MRKKVISVHEAARVSARTRKSGQIVVTTNGCFDILHIGHIRNLMWAKQRGNILIVGINSDSSVRKLKGSPRPIIPAKERAEMLAALMCVDYVFIFSGSSPLPFLRILRPSVHVKGKDSEHTSAFRAEKRAVEQAGGIVRLAPHLKGHSTTDIVETVLERNKKSRG